MSDDVQALVERAKEGNLASASELIGRFYERIFAYFRRLSGSDSEAADLTQKTFCRAWSGLAKFDGRASFNTWLHAIGHHVYVDWRRRSSRLEMQSNEWWAECVADGPGPFDNVADRDAAQLLYAQVERLEEEQRETIHLHYYQALSIQETADALNIATSTVKYRLRQALDRLKSRMAEPRLGLERKS
jgi:RNA polymerase sigma-70 factor (ECF subfamily)